MSNDDLTTLIRQLEHNLSSDSHRTSPQLLTRAKLALLAQNALTPSANTPPQLRHAAQHVLELGALISISGEDAKAFTRYFQQLQPFYLGGGGGGASASPSQPPSQRSKITGLYLLSLLSQGDYAGFHTLLESLEVAAELEQEEGRGKGLEDDEFVQYPIRLEQWLMEGSYDRVWEETKSERVPSPEFAIFSHILIDTIRSEVASCSEKAYPSIPVANAKSLLFLDSEGSVVGFAQQRGWHAADGRVYFPTSSAGADGVNGAGVDGVGGGDMMEGSARVIENALGYARELETIV